MLCLREAPTLEPGDPADDGVFMAASLGAFAKTLDLRSQASHNVPTMMIPNP